MANPDKTILLLQPPGQHGGIADDDLGVPPTLKSHSQTQCHLSYSNNRLPTGECVGALYGDGHIAAHGSKFLKFINISISSISLLPGCDHTQVTSLPPDHPATDVAA